MEFTEDLDSLAKTAEGCNTKKDSAQSAQEQSVHIESCRMMDKKRAELDSDFISEAIVICVYESAFDVLIPEYGFEKRVHCDQLPLKKAEFRKDERVLELYWEKGVPSSAFVPEDERPKAGSGSRYQRNAASEAQSATSNQKSRETDDAQRRQMDTGTMSTDDVDALFDDEDSISEVTDMAAGVSLGGDRPTQSMPPSPTGGELGTDPNRQRTRSDPKLASSSGETGEANLSNKERYLSFFKLREEEGEFIQDVTEMTRVPVILKTDLTKSPP